MTYLEELNAELDEIRKKLEPNPWNRKIRAEFGKVAGIERDWRLYLETR